MNEQDFPALYRSADGLSSQSQSYFFRAMKVHLFTLVLAALLSIISMPHWTVAALQLVALLAALGCSIYLFSMRPDRFWYAGRAAAESIKTIVWRYISRAEPFQGADDKARTQFHIKLKAVADQNRDVFKSFTEHLNGTQITSVMDQLRRKDLDERKKVYAEDRVADQQLWYAIKARFNEKMSKRFFWILIVINSLAVVSAILRIVNAATPFWPTDVLVAAAASVLSWMQAKRFSELAASYALAAHEISFIRDQSLLPSTDEDFSIFVGDAENAFSREHTQWVARKDA
ncbi:DUF4231 domain-containing protein [Xanthomonas hortorum]|uniref:DUF4231 domain-containing protein n=1 Tax=Xanthomonas hortorum TaxID=56454 RepID=UPI0015D617A0|nr:DUF4231 domain-containing protein [Xanthomonas hortorum]MCE4356748.1 DUF4231 domain-containing protein [Xanthomonas hortorum pv. taraxaci]NMI51112.1 DUF4231 domain-containing protein [Xanthomonas hortorum pv. taraxaci]CAD0358718.1 hypothetical protein NCPPB940_43080 [Xanthomonas hortorum pv. taraxaci]CAD0358728.1 hypothetical protein NCPPB940_43080 [Xanthomonas hortorum pv. taraxaci]